MVTHYKSKEDRRKQRTRAKLNGTSERPRLSVFRSNKMIYVQVIDDTKHITLFGTSEKGAKIEQKNTMERAKLLGKFIADHLKKQKITKVVFDRGGYAYHGRVQALCEGLREGGIQV